MLQYWLKVYMHQFWLVTSIHNSMHLSTQQCMFICDRVGHLRDRKIIWGDNFAFLSNLHKYCCLCYCIL